MRKLQFKDTYKALPSGLTIKESTVCDGLGLFAIEDVAAGIYLGETHIWEKKRWEWIRTPLGGFINHSEDPNCFINENIHYHDGQQRELYTVRPIMGDIPGGEELLIYYKLPEYYAT